MNIDQIDICGKRVFIRADLNVPLRDGQITDDTRIRASLKSIQKAIDEDCKVTVLSHLGRPTEGIFDGALSLAPVAERLGQLLEMPVVLFEGLKDSQNLGKGDVGLLENVRFLKGETSNSDALGKEMAAYCDVFIMDAFGSAHRAHASTNSIAKHADEACQGYLMASELKALSRALAKPARPLVAILGGSKVSTKLALLDRLSELADRIIVGGGIANTFIAARGFAIGKSLFEPNMIDLAKTIMSKTVIPIPTDVIVAKRMHETETGIVRSIDGVQQDEMIMDVGPETSRNWASSLQDAETILWNGPIGVFEFEQFGGGTREIAEGVASSTAFSLAGGGDTLAAIEKYNASGGVSYMSTGGGAFMEFVEGKELPGLKVLEDRL